MCSMSWPRDENVRVQPLNLHVFVKKTAIAETTGIQDDVDILPVPCTYRLLLLYLVWRMISQSHAVVLHQYYVCLCVFYILNSTHKTCHPHEQSSTTLYMYIPCILTYMIFPGIASGLTTAVGGF